MTQETRPSRNRTCVARRTGWVRAPTRSSCDGEVQIEPSLTAPRASLIAALQDERVCGGVGMRADSAPETRPQREAAGLKPIAETNEEETAMRERRLRQMAGMVLLGGVIALNAKCVTANPCTNPKGGCGTAPSYQFVGCAEYTARPALGVRAQVSRYDPKLCGDTQSVAGSFWWVMLHTAEHRWVQAGWYKGYSKQHTDGSLANFWEYKCPNAEPALVSCRDWGAPYEGAAPCSCSVETEDPEGIAYRMTAGNVSHVSPKYSPRNCLYTAALKGETWHPNNQMPGDRDDKVAFQECQTRWRDAAGEQWRKAGLTEVPGQGDSTDYGLGITTETVGGQERTVVRVGDKHCPEP